MEYQNLDPSLREQQEDYSDHPDTGLRELKLSQLMSDYGVGHVTVQGRKDIYIDGEKFLSVDWTSDEFDNTAENAYYVAGALSKAFHDYDTVEEWQFRDDGRGGVTCLSPDRVNGTLHAFLQKNGNGARLQQMVTKAYRVEKATGFREKMKLAEGKRLAELQQARAEALAVGTKAMKKMRENADTYSDFGFGKEALFQMERTFAAEKQDNEAENYAIRGRAKAVAGDYEGALLDADRAVSLDNRNIYNFLNRADVRHMRGEREAALADCESAKALDGKNPVTYLLAAQIYEEMGNAEQALAHYKELHRLAPRAFRKIPEEYLQEISEKDYKELQKEKEEAKKAREEKEKRG